MIADIISNKKLNSIVTELNTMNFLMLEKELLVLLRGTCF